MTRLTLFLGSLWWRLFVAALLIGPAHISAGPSLRALIMGGEGPMTLVMREIRLPRALLGLLIGGALGLAGAAMQGYLRNPLADPGLIGVSGSAALGAVLAIQTGLRCDVVAGAAVGGAELARCWVSAPCCCSLVRGDRHSA